jgi:hypothetical protein
MEATVSSCGMKSLDKRIKEIGVKIHQGARINFELGQL